MQMFEGSALYIEGNLTITGDGGEIEGEPGSSELQHARIKDRPGSSKRLTIAGFNNTYRSRSFLLRGAFDVQVALTNNAYVIADKKDPLILSGVPKGKNHTGYWVAEHDPDAVGEVGELRVDTEVRGGGTWELIDPDATATITINAPCPYLTGKVVIENGSFYVNANFTTTGQLILRSVNGTEPVVTVQPGKIFTCSQ